MLYYIGIGILVLVIAFFMAATQKARGYNFWRYFIVSLVIVASIYMMLENLVLKPK
ncbi:hypothetical protein OAD98_02930 [Flavobacteriales bacterium]|jgi:hypothetical protein|nr:hypothetical protein [Flavobacteriales bacterium]MDC0015500.1 hypothetical protein [Flavobacteriales bacterium]MDG1174533.1 hypothetical protein [Flavobacteriales bacterium]|tara:strand:+ start:302 stop:469 length:168 start_codon:yes stop_codon:yes gene_type:complete